jgi:hypothetical protein
MSHSTEVRKSRVSSKGHGSYTKKSFVMSIKISEKKLLLGIMCLAAGIILLIQTRIVVKPVLVSEKGLFFCAAALCFLVLAMRFFKRAAIKA